MFIALRLRGPMMGGGGPRIDGHPQPLPIPTRSMLTGLLGAALGIERGQPEKLQAIQDHMRMGIAVHRQPVPIRDYQTTDLSQRHLQGPMWMRDGTGAVGIFERGGANIDSIVEQNRPYLCDVDMTVVMEFLPAAPVMLDKIDIALEQPRYPLFLGTTTCPPSHPIKARSVDATSLEDAVLQVRETDDVMMWLPLEATSASAHGDLLHPIPDTRDWTAGRHGGETVYVARQ